MSTQYIYSTFTLTNVGCHNFYMSDESRLDQDRRRDSKMIIIKKGFTQRAEYLLYFSGYCVS